MFNVNNSLLKLKISAAKDLIFSIAGVNPIKFNISPFLKKHSSKIVLVSPVLIMKMNKYGMMLEAKKNV